MTDLERRPIRTVLEDGYSDLDVQRIWRSVEKRLSRRPVERSRRRAAMAVASGTLMAGLAWFYWQTASRPGPLEVVWGGLPSALRTEAIGPPEEVTLGDGSHIWVDPGGQIDIAHNDGVSFHVVLRKGKATFDVHPHGPRRWMVESELATVEVVGTKFACEQEDARLVISVERGVVVVRGGRVPNGVQRLLAGEKFIVTADPSIASTGVSRMAGSDEPIAAVDLGTGGAPSVLAPAVTQPAAGPQPAAELKATHDLPSSAVAPFGAGGSQGKAASDPIDELLRQADNARRAGDDARAIQLLERVVSEAPHDSRAPITAFTLARLQMVQSPARAAASLVIALAGPIPKWLEEDARARLVEAHARAGNRESAARAATDYESRYPAGSRLEEVRRWVRAE